VDAKYKLYQDEKIEPGDVYQLFFYAYAYDRPSTEEQRPARAFILYPSTDEWHHIRLRTQTAEAAPTARLVGWGVNVPKALDAIATSRIHQLPFVGALSGVGT
jgi:5-methylcytosine-specific restriction endonuclease McrBC regulatory subunit McrC